jgi:transposase
MDDITLYANILGIAHPWKVTEVRPDLAKGSITVRVEIPTCESLACPECGDECPRHDHRVRRWRHLPTCQYRTIIEADVPRVRCLKHKVHQVQIPWAESNSSFTALFEGVVISWLKEASFSAVAKRLDLTWDQIDGIQERAVRRGLARRTAVVPKRMGVDETSFKKRHDYVTVVNDLDGGGVLHVGDGRGKEALNGFYSSFLTEDLAKIEVVAMDMHGPFIWSTVQYLEEPELKIAFDWFHVVQHLNQAVDKTRRIENKQLRKEGDERLVKTKYWWLHRKGGEHASVRLSFKKLKDSALETALAWAMKEAAANIRGYRVRGWARRAWRKWIDWALESGSPPMIKVAKMIQYHLVGILNADLLRTTNARSESLNAKIQKVKRMACGYRNKERFKNAIYFHLGKLDLSPSVAGSHTIP